MIRFRLAELLADKTFKERRSVPVSEVAEATGVHRSTLSKMLNHPGVNVGSDVIDKLCGYFGCQPGDLMTYVSTATDLIEDEQPTGLGTQPKGTRAHGPQEHRGNRTKGE